jgi:hypothetical protein
MQAVGLWFIPGASNWPHDTQYNDTEHKNKSMTQSEYKTQNTAISCPIVLSISHCCCYAECRYAKCRFVECRETVKLMVAY